jgi:hypothetical protein
MKHTKTLPDGRRVDVDRLHQLLETERVERVPMSQIKGAQKLHPSYTRTRLLMCDPDRPGIVDAHNFLLDGRHRYRRRLAMGRRSMPVRRASLQQIEACIIDADRPIRARF